MHGEPGKLGANLSGPAYAGWQRFADRHGLTMTALAEAIGLELAGLVDVDRRKLPPAIRRAVEAATGIRAQKAARRPR